MRISTISEKPGKSTGAGSVGTRRLATFWLSGRLFGVDSETVKDVVSTDYYRPFQTGQREIQGYVTFRGDIYLVVDLNVILGLEAGGISSEGGVIIVNCSPDWDFGVLADSVGAVVEVEAAKINMRTFDGRFEYPEFDRDPVVGVYGLSDDVLFVLDIARLVRPLSQFAAKGPSSFDGDDVGIG